MSNINDCRCILVIGSTSGLGRRLALSILNLPSSPTVIVCGRRQERLRSMLSSYGSSGRLKAIPLDVTAPPATLRSAVNAILSAHPNVWFIMTTHLTLSCSRTVLSITPILRNQNLLTWICYLPS
ncbi:hypothetical protein ID866_7105 [Astraeus odoratus]|nr:hypothetical protein ID866_7105 [Astraeus odoratus]